jgi:hypothetical protein
MKTLLFFILIIFVYFIIKFILNRINQLKEESTQKDAPLMDPTQMVICHKCGVHIPKDEALILVNSNDNDETKYACCTEHG